MERRASGLRLAFEVNEVRGALLPIADGIFDYLHTDIENRSDLIKTFLKPLVVRRTINSPIKQQPSPPRWARCFI